MTLERILVTVPDGSIHNWPDAVSYHVKDGVLFIKTRTKEAAYASGAWLIVSQLPASLTAELPY